MSTILYLKHGDVPITYWDMYYNTGRRKAVCVCFAELENHRQRMRQHAKFMDLEVHQYDLGFALYDKCVEHGWFPYHMDNLPSDDLLTKIPALAEYVSKANLVVDRKSQEAFAVREKTNRRFRLSHEAMTLRAGNPDQNPKGLTILPSEDVSILYYPEYRVSTVFTANGYYGIFATKYDAILVANKIIEMNPSQRAALQFHANPDIASYYKVNDPLLLEKVGL